MEESSKWALALLQTAFTFLLGAPDKLIVILVVLSVIDFILGFAKARRGKSEKTQSGGLSSTAAAKGLEKKGVMFMVLIVANVCDLMFNVGGMIRTAALWFYITTEALSIIENAALIGVKIPKFLINVLEVKNKMADEGNLENNKIEVKKNENI